MKHITLSRAHDTAHRVWVRAMLRVGMHLIMACLLVDLSCSDLLPCEVHHAPTEEHGYAAVLIRALAHVGLGGRLGGGVPVGVVRGGVPSHEVMQREGV